MHMSSEERRGDFKLKHYIHYLPPENSRIIVDIYSTLWLSLERIMKTCKALIRGSEAYFTLW
jgi:hypothetical protein